MLPADAPEEFVNAWDEWHYFVGGASLGFVLGWVCGAVFTLSVIVLA